MWTICYGLCGVMFATKLYNTLRTLVSDGSIVIRANEYNLQFDDDDEKDVLILKKHTWAVKTTRLCAPLFITS